VPVVIAGTHFAQNIEIWLHPFPSYLPSGLIYQAPVRSGNSPNWRVVRFRDSRGRTSAWGTPVADARNIVKIILLLLGEQAAKVRLEASRGCILAGCILAGCILAGCTTAPRLHDRAEILCT
jgi:hypothetical protein